MYYDDFGDLVEVRKADQTLLATYTYDENHRRIRKVTTAAAAHGAGTTDYHYLPDGRLLAETAPGNQPQATYIWNGPTLTGFITYNPRTLHTVQVDQLGSPYQIRSLAGQVLWRWESEGYGGTAPNEDVDGDGTRLVFNPRFPGQYYDQESGLHYNGHRYYHPRLGRYISSDPIGVAGGLNTYLYVGGNPLTGFDPIGLSNAVSPLENIGVGIAGGYSGGMSYGSAGGARALPYYPIPARGLPPSNIRPPVKDPDLCKPCPASAATERARGGQSLWDERGGEWRYFPGDKYHNPHWDYNPWGSPSSPWQNIEIGNMPHLK